MRGNLRQRGQRTLAHLDAAGEDVERPVGVELRHGRRRERAHALDDCRDALGANLRPLAHRRVAVRPADPFRRGAQQLRVVEVLGDRLAGGELVARHEAVAQAQLERVHAQLIGELVHLALVRPRHLRNAEAAEGDRRGDVGVDPERVDVNVRHAVWAHRRVAAGDLLGRLLGVRAAVVPARRLVGDERAVPLGAGLDPHPRRVLGVGEELLVALQSEAHRLARLAREPRRDGLDRRVDLPAVGTAQRAHDHAHVGRGKLEKVGDLGLDPVRRLGGVPERQSLVAPAGDNNVRLHRHVLDGRAVEGVLDDDLGLGEAGVDVALALDELVDDVGALEARLSGEDVGAAAGQRARPLVKDGRARLERGLDVEYGRQHLVLHLDQVQRLFRGGIVGRGNGRHDVTHVAHLVQRHRRLIADEQAERGIHVVAAEDVVAGQDGHSTQRGGPGRVDAARSSRVRRASAGRASGACPGARCRGRSPWPRSRGQPRRPSATACRSGRRAHATEGASKRSSAPSQSSKCSTSAGKESGSS